MCRTVGKRGKKRPCPETVRSSWSIQAGGKMQGGHPGHIDECAGAWPSFGKRPRRRREMTGTREGVMVVAEGATEWVRFSLP